MEKGKETPEELENTKSFFNNPHLQNGIVLLLITLIGAWSLMIYEQYGKIREIELEPIEETILLKELERDSCNLLIGKNDSQVIIHNRVVIKKDLTIKNLIFKIRNLVSLILQAGKE